MQEVNFFAFLSGLQIDFFTFLLRFWPFVHLGDIWYLQGDLIF
jgi:hypothetical protein